MRYKSVLLAIMLFSVELFGQKEYMVRLGMFKQIENARLVQKKVPGSVLYRSRPNKRDVVYYHLCYDHLSKKKAEELLKKSKAVIKDAYISPQPVQKKKPHVKQKNKIKKVMHLTRAEKDVDKNSQNKSRKQVVISDKNASSSQISVKKEKKISQPLPNPKPEGMHLKDAILYALHRSKRILSRREKVIQAKRVLDQKLAAYKPTLDLAGSMGAVYLHPDKKPDEKYKKGDLSVTLKENIYAGGKHSEEIARERENLKAAEAKFRSEVEQEVLKIIDAYYSLVFGEKSIHINRQNTKKLEEIRNIVEIKTKNGAATEGDLNYIKSQYQNASSALVKAESSYQNSIAFYEYYVGKLAPGKHPVDQNFTFPSLELEALLDVLHRKNAKLMISRAKLDAEKYNLESLKAKFRPSLDLSLLSKAKRSGYVAEPKEDRVSAILSMHYNLYNGGKDKARLLGSKSKISELHYKMIDQQMGIEYNLKQLYESAKSSQSSMHYIENEVHANKKVTESYWNAFKYGTQDIQALLLAQRALNRSQLDLLKEMKSYLTNQFKLMQAAGNLLDILGVDDFVDSKKMDQAEELNLFSRG